MKRALLALSGLLILLACFTKTSAQSSCTADINLDNFVDITDYSILAADLFKISPANPRSDINSDGIVDITDYSLLAAQFLQTCNTNQSNEWTQHAGNPQRSGYSPLTIPTPWRYKWQWNGADANGKPQTTHLSVPKMVQPISGGGRIYMVAANAVYALNRNNGAVIWSRSGIGNLVATPAYDAGYLYIASQDGRLYKLNATDGSITNSITIGGALNNPPLVASGNIYVGTTLGKLTAVNSNSFTTKWEYQAGSAIVTAAAFSASRNIVIVNSQDLYVHAINVADGTQKWRVKPTARIYQSGTPNTTGAQFEDSWPVIAEKAGIVFVKYRLDWDTLWASNPYPTTNAEIRSFLQANPNQQTLFALNIGSGAVAFIPAVGNGGAGDGGTLPMGPQPVVKEVNGKEVVYTIWRNRLTCASGWCDGREDATMGEMVLDDTTVPGYKAGDVRFVQYIDIQTDEMVNVTMAGNTIFHSHWLINSARTITDRNNALGATYTSPIKTVDAPNVIWRQCYCPPDNPNCNPIHYPGGSGYTWCPSNCPFNTATRYCPQGLFSYGDQRSYSPGFYQYHNASNGGSEGFTVVTDSLVLIKTYDGGIMALEQGNPVADSGSEQVVAQSVLGLQQTTSLTIDYTEARKYVGTVAKVKGVVRSVKNNLPKAIYIGFKDPHDGELLVRVFAKDIEKFDYDLKTLLGKEIVVTGYISLYWPDNIDPEIEVTEPRQIEVGE